MLKLYSNIKRLRKLHNMNQQELAEAVGYTSKSMIAQIENGKVDLSASMISKFAEVFNVNEIDLMDSDIAELPSNDKATELYEKFESLPPDKQAAFLNYLEYLRSGS